MPKIVKNNQTSKNIDKQEFVESFSIELESEDIDLTINYIIQSGICSFLKLRRMSDPELITIITENYKAALENLLQQEKEKEESEKKDTIKIDYPPILPYNPFPNPWGPPTPGNPYIKYGISSTSSGKRGSIDLDSQNLNVDLLSGNPIAGANINNQANNLVDKETQKTFKISSEEQHRIKKLLNNSKINVNLGVGDK